MEDEAFKAAVLGRLDRIEIDRLRFDQVDRRLDAIARRLDEQDNASDLMVEKFDRLSVMVREAMSASEQPCRA